MFHIAILLQSILGFHGCHNKDDPSIGGLGDVGPGWNEISVEMDLKELMAPASEGDRIKGLGKACKLGLRRHFVLG